MLVFPHPFFTNAPLIIRSTRPLGADAKMGATMIAAARRTFRVERLTAPEDIANDDSAQDGRHGEIMAALRALDAKLSQSSAPNQSAPAEAQDSVLLDKYREEMAQALKLKAELDSIYSAINDTKKEIASLHYSGFQGDEMSRVTDELGAIVTGTEHATESILSAAEAIDDKAGNLAAKLEGDDQGMASDIQEQVVTVFEACNFQDLTGQRITKVVNVLRFIEDRVVSMMDIWGGIETFSTITPIEHTAAEGDAALLNGPALASDEGVASQDDIDALFN